MSTPNPDRIAELSRIICAEVPILIEEARDQINAAINAIVEQAQETEDSKSILTIGITAKWDLDGQSVVVSMPINVRHKFSRTATMDDPNQPKLPLVESEDWGKTNIVGERVTITTGGGSITQEQAERILKAAAKSGDRARRQAEDGGAS